MIIGAISSEFSNETDESFAVISAASSPAPALSESRIRDVYPPIENLRDLWVRTSSVTGRNLPFSGESLVINVGGEDERYELGACGGMFGLGESGGEDFRPVIQIIVNEFCYLQPDARVPSVLREHHVRWIQPA